MAASTSVSKPLTDNFQGLKCQPNTYICREKTIILGDVTIGKDCVIHPATTIIAKKGPIIIGNSNLIEERVKIVNDRPEAMTIGDHNVFEVDTYCEASLIGNHNILESKSRVGKNIELTNNCVIGAGCDLIDDTSQSDEETDRLPPYTVISGKDLTRRIVTGMPTNLYTSQLDFLRKVLPNYQMLLKPVASNLASTPQSK